MQISYSGVLYHVLLRLLYVLSFILTFLCSCVLLPRNPSSNIPFWPYSSWPSPLSFSFSLPLFSLSPSLESHMVSLKWSAIKRGAQGAHCPHLFSCSAWAVPLLVETVSCDILCQPEVKLPGAFMQHIPKFSGYVLYRTADYFFSKQRVLHFLRCVAGNLCICDLLISKLQSGVSIQTACSFSALFVHDLSTTASSLYARNQNMLYKSK